MTALAIEQLILGFLGAAPQLMTLYAKVVGGGTATAADVQAIIQKYGIDRAVAVAAIEVAETQGK